MKKITNKITCGATIEQQTNNKQITTNKNDKNNKNEKKIRSCSNDVAEITKCYEGNIGMITPAVAETLFSYLDTMSYELIIEAIKISTLRNKRNMSYIKGILNDWNKKGYKLLADIQEENQKNKKDKEREEWLND